MTACDSWVLQSTASPSQDPRGFSSSEEKIDMQAMACQSLFIFCKYLPFTYTRILTFSLYQA